MLNVYERILLYDTEFTKNGSELRLYRPHKENYPNFLLLTEKGKR